VHTLNTGLQLYQCAVNDSIALAKWRIRSLCPYHSESTQGRSDGGYIGIYTPQISPP